MIVSAVLPHLNWLQHLTDEGIGGTAQRPGEQDAASHHQQLSSSWVPTQSTDVTLMPPSLALTEEETRTLQEIVRKGRNWRKQDCAETLLRLSHAWRARQGGGPGSEALHTNRLRASP
ncbi:hypothetical protein GCM10027514_41690 [Azotobacter armeniacus]